MKLEVYDLEVYKEMFLYEGWNREERVWYEYEISEERNDLFGLCKHILDKELDYLVGFNVLKYDAQILQYIIDEHQKWVDMDWNTVMMKIYKFSQEVIETTKYDAFPPYREEMFTKRQIDLFTIHHFDNENKRVSLKWLEFMMDLEDIEETPVDFRKEELNNEERKLIRHYCKNDVKAEDKFLDVTFGDTDNEEYRGKNKIQDRFDVIDEFKFPIKALNWSDVKIGDEINLKGYMDLTRLDRKEVYELKKARGGTRPFTFGDCIPSYVKFQVPEFIEFFNKVRKIRVKLTDKQEYPFSYRGTNYMIAKGGIHSDEKKRVIVPAPDETLMDADVGSQYPNALRKRKLFPRHLGERWNQNFGANITRRLEWKKKGKTDKRYKGLSDMMKLALNGGGFGKTNERNSWQYGPEAHFACTIGNQFEILMLIEQMELNGIHVVSANTDGIVCLYKTNKQPDYDRVCKKWEEIVGNTELGQLEYTEYESITQLSVNDYIAIKKDEKGKERVKKKGDFLTDFEINKNKSRRIVPLALEKYYVEGIPVEETIIKHKNIFDFCIGKKGTANYTFNIGEKVYQSVVRYYITREGNFLLKVKREGSEATGPKISHAEAPDKIDDREWKCRVVNQINPSKPIEEYNIDYEYYIRKCNNIIKSIENPRKKNQLENKNQLNIF